MRPASPAVLTGVHEILAGYKEIGNINEVQTMHLGPDDVLLALSVDFVDQMPSEEVEAIIYKLEKQIKTEYPEIRRLFIEAQDKAHHDESAKVEAKKRHEADMPKTFGQKKPGGRNARFFNFLLCVRAMRYVEIDMVSKTLIANRVPISLRHVNDRSFCTSADRPLFH